MLDHLINELSCVRFDADSSQVVVELMQPSEVISATSQLQLRNFTKL